MAILNKVAKGNLLWKVDISAKIQVSQVNVVAMRMFWGESIPGRRKSQCKSFTMVACLMCSRRTRKPVWLVPNECGKEILEAASVVTT